MKLTYDPKRNIAYLQLGKKERRKVKTIPVCRSLKVDIDSQGRVSGIEFLDANKQVLEESRGELRVENVALRWNAKLELPGTQVTQGMIHSGILKAAAPSFEEREVLKKSISILCKHLNPSRIILFGSRAKGTARTSSDFDFALDQKRPAEAKEDHFRGELDGIRGLHRIDVVFLRSVDRDFREVVLTTGKTIYEKRIRSCV